ncbi:MAG: protein translocase subunit SecD [Myxococcota bacterium]
MDRGWYLRLLLTIGMVGLAAYLIYPSYHFYADFSPRQDAEEEQARAEGKELDRSKENEKFCGELPTGVPCSKFNLGLDLQGGVHLVMGVEVQKAVEQRLDRAMESLREAMKEKSIGFTRVDRPKDQVFFTVDLANGDQARDLDKLLQLDFGALEVEDRSGGRFTLKLLDQEATFQANMAVEQAIKTIRNRADKFGVTEPTIARRGTDSILIQLPGIKDPDRAISLIGKTAQLAFHVVDTQGSNVLATVDERELPAGTERKERSSEAGSETYFEVPAEKREELLAVVSGVVPSNRVLLFGKKVGANGKPVEPETLVSYYLESRAGLTGEYLVSASAQPNPEFPSQFEVTMKFDLQGAKLFGDLTGANVNRHMAIVLDDEVNSAPIITEKIGGGNARIRLGRGGSPNQQREEATDLALVLRAGALPAPVEIREQREVGRTLGEEAVASGQLAIMVGLGLVLLFMIVYYKLSGAVANIALVLNLVFVIAVLAMFEATLTLPGMAGILLTIGMAVDANVIIFERIREELRAGKTPRAAIDAGYGKAFSTIFDANVTTLIAGVVLMQYGTGPVRGFAVTLIIGILCSMFTAIVVTRLVFDFFSNRRRLKSLSI